MERKNNSKLLSNNNDLPPIASRPKVVLVNPNFQRKPVLPRKTIYLNPLFRRTASSSKQVFSNHTASSSASNSEDELIQPCNDASSASFLTSIQNLKSLDKNLKTFETPCSSKNDLLSKNTNDIVASDSSQTHLKSINDTASTISKIAPLPVVYQEFTGPNVNQPKKAYVNPRFLKNPENTDNDVQRKASFFYLNGKKFKLESETPGIKNSGLLDHGVKYPCVNTASKICPPLAVGSAVNAVQQTILDLNALPSPANSDLRTKASINIQPAPTSTCSSAMSSSLALKSMQKKKMNLLRLQKITRLAQLAQVPYLRKKDIKSHPRMKNVANFNKFKFKPFSSKNISYIQNSAPQVKKNFSRHNLSSPRESISQECRDNNHHYSTYQQECPVFKRCSKFKLVLKHSLNKIKTGPLNNSMPSNQSISKSNQMHSRNLVCLNPRKLVKINEKNLQQSSSQNVNNEKEDSTSVLKIKENISSHDVASTSQILHYVSNKKLIRKPSTKKDSHQKNRSFISKNKYILRNINVVISKNYATRFKISFKPSRTSSDVINKRIVQRKVINRYKLLNVQQNVNRVENTSASSVSTEPIRNESKSSSSAGKERRNSVIRNRNSSFISIGKTKLIRKSVLNQKLRSRKVRANNLKLTNAVSLKDAKKTNLQNLSGNSSGNRKAFHNDLIAIGKTKLVKRSSLHWQRQVNELRTKRNNVAAASVIQKQLKKFYKSLPDNHQNVKLLKKIPASTRKSKNVLSYVKNKQLMKKRIALRCKNNIPCEIFHRYGKCKKFLIGKCFKLHDKKYVAICQAFIRGACKNETCLLSHEIVPQKMPTCHHFLQGACSRDNCKYPHVKLSAKAPICRDFVRGFCSLGLDCDKLHVLMCPESEKKGFCINRPNCKFAHRKKKKIPNKSSGKNETSNLIATEHSSKTESSSNLEFSNNEATKRYFSKDSENELESYIPKRPQLGSLPSFIPLNTCDTTIKN